jgi:hypothetical protein
MSRKLSESEKNLLNQLIITCELRHLTEKESLSYIQKRFGRLISRRTFYQIKRCLYEEKILKKSESFLLFGKRPLLPEYRSLYANNPESKKYSNVNDLDFIPQHTYKIFSEGDNFIIRSRNFLARINDLKVTSTKNYESVPSKATIRKEYVKCGNHSCCRCKHGPYYYAYWRDETGKLRKKYLGKHDPRDKDTLNLIDLTKLRTSFEP